MTTDLDRLRDRVEALLKDAGNVDWSAAELDDNVRLALHELSGVLPVRASTLIEAVDGQYEYDLSSINSLGAVVEVWYPYLATDAGYKLPHPIQWRLLTDNVLYLEVGAGAEPDSSYDIRVFYDKLQSLSGLDGAAATTLSEEEKSVLVGGAAGFAAYALGRDKIDAVTFGEASDDLRQWGSARVSEFRSRLAELAQREAANDDARIGWWSTDKWDEA